MELQESRAEHPAMTFDEVSMERSKSFVKALQMLGIVSSHKVILQTGLIGFEIFVFVPVNYFFKELKNLRPQLYSAAEYCEKSYLHSEQKQMVLDNLKDYAVRALVNAVDHLGTVAYKLTDLLDQQTLDVSTMELKVSCVNQKLLTCQTYMDKEGIRQQQLLAFIPRHHKHYILPNSVNKKVHFSLQVQRDASQNHIQARPRIYPTGNATSKTLSWHLASETKSTLKGSANAFLSTNEPETSGKTSRVFHLLDSEETIRTSGGPAGGGPSSGPASSAVTQSLGVVWRVMSKSTRKSTCPTFF
ncbi:Protein ABIL1 [Vitis vinifera]|uniref:Protein ABIL1 n=1 Tax=Vitis vinifera TaxID=29760 RepID=A0A438JLR5_VITVI|nr:Protein ABIL1 [Vitis vinifera]